MAAAEQGLIGDHQVDRDRDRIGGGLSGDPGDQGVGHDLPTAASVTLGGQGVRDPGQGGPHRDPLGRGQQRGELGHGVGCGAQGDVAFGLGTTAPVHHRCGVQGVDPSLGLGDQAALSPPVDHMGAVRAGRHRSASTTARSSRDRQVVSRAIRVARHSERAPVRSAARVCGSSVVNVFARPRSRAPRAGDSRRANATWRRPHARAGWRGASGRRGGHAPRHPGRRRARPATHTPGTSGPPSPHRLHPGGVIAHLSQGAEVSGKSGIGHT